jgi:hypothetical protein|tara:strand:- start:328 stop:567 length:240 start_codon:yes stop_codon:yes gene_type:complete
MKYEKILLALELIEGELDDASNQLPDYNANSDAQVSLDCAKNELYCLKDDIEKAILDENRVISGDELEEVLHHPPVSLL